ncbi:MAG: type 11 methyltransferase [Candidatus Gottesmanbacteria bacterium GW2011_GWB1_43_11]|uniref:Type 11 methyltransferase n=1 Tax=Candidatus Gottesmanbacteria bacterium GW2011_GWB1_43_11 TaxID=1618446 RepID=A0A0G1CNW1_9BACT|nr:MAG: type 11 methyltransferase [Candidatus Gottesmanbacteria bacterium GW2011_GWA2_42_16]KKS56118.1 MAG: type 11 methyltransferase [Candidatus Gottesmanbacteria bacterium GW2011_GWA1_42_26]KKS82439.1 MAG: type 11 methyltransferase [Candidatus Gottesmanbacteria bacterium GW2011_GWC1_43_10]KKS87162.1 MAG: type 11 methyltransferase [Candidatus Gottesmanbacteria bacterium GW2011_GWB1_43_11]OGG08516.1 MAG: hypothetical protein A2699_05490 [Candidatus Gottesmanbacteria bacterium RIFCSPHIGHO2_01_FU
MASLNSWKTLGLHRRQIRSKPFLHRLYIDFYKLLLSTDLPLGKIVEIGSGGGLIKDIKSEIVTSDIIKGRGIDRVFSADRIPFRPKSVAAYMMLNTFHHLKDPEKALVEMSRTLKTGGKIRMIEPYNSWWGGWIYKYLHSEPYQPQADWRIIGKGRLTGANTALPWIVFVRDRKLLTQKLPQLKFVSLVPHTPFRYLISGGLTAWQFLPTCLYSLVKTIENELVALFPNLSMFCTIELEKV